MAVNTEARYALIEALNEELGADPPGSAFQAWAQSLLAQNQINAEVMTEIQYVIDAVVVA